jgi:hypothetical protein
MNAKTAMVAAFVALGVFLVYQVIATRPKSP